MRLLQLDGYNAILIATSMNDHIKDGSLHKIFLKNHSSNNNLPTLVIYNTKHKETKIRYKP